jgi:hypothetical protein
MRWLAVIDKYVEPSTLVLETEASELQVATRATCSDLELDGVAIPFTATLLQRCDARAHCSSDQATNRGVFETVAEPKSFATNPPVVNLETCWCTVAILQDDREPVAPEIRQQPNRK